MGFSHHTIRNYLDLLEQTFLVRLLPPFLSNAKKRLVKSPKIFVRDTGLLHALLEIETSDDLLGHPVYGHSWEGMLFENILSALPKWRGHFFRTATREEIDLLLQKGNKTIAIECKASSAPKVNTSFYQAVEICRADEAWCIAPVSESYTVNGVRYANLEGFLTEYARP